MRSIITAIGVALVGLMLTATVALAANPSVYKDYGLAKFANKCATRIGLTGQRDGTGRIVQTGVRVAVECADMYRVKIDRIVLQGGDPGYPVLIDDPGQPSQVTYTYRYTRLVAPTRAKLRAQLWYSWRDNRNQPHHTSRLTTWDMTAYYS